MTSGRRPVGTRSRRRVALPEPPRERARQLGVGERSGPGDVAVGADQHGVGRVDLADHRELPHARRGSRSTQRGRGRPTVRGRTSHCVAEGEEDRPGVVQQLVDPRRARRPCRGRGRASGARPGGGRRRGRSGRRGRSASRRCAGAARPWRAARPSSRAGPRGGRRASRARPGRSCCAAPARRSGGARRGRCRAGRRATCPATTCASFQPRFTASCTPRLRPCPPCGGCTCAASPASSTRPAR